LASLFIFDTAGVGTAIGDLVESLEAAAWRGLDVRVLLGGSRVNMSIAETAAGSAKVLADRRIQTRWLSAHGVRGSHAKYVVVDDTSLLGSHNWSRGALTNQTQDSILVRSPDLAAYLTGYFNGQWARAVRS
jgi:phosphatidylserine/phosphatidylglycerophosphate/cardiolipin synthase-like enzyme